MKLQDLEIHNPITTSQKVFENTFGTNIDFGAVSTEKATQMLARTKRLISEHRNSSKLHNSETNPNYLKLMVMEQALTAKVDEDLAQAAMKDPATKRIVDKAKRGQQLTPDEQKTMNAIALSKTDESEEPKKVMESEVQQAQVVLAAQDVTDRIQKMLEDVTEMKFKDLPALVDSIRNEVGINEAQQYSGDTSSALDTLIACLTETKTAIESAQGVITGQEPIVPGEEDAMDMAPADDADDIDADAQVDDSEDDDTRSDLEASLGRARR